MATLPFTGYFTMHRQSVSPPRRRLGQSAAAVWQWQSVRGGPLTKNNQLETEMNMMQWLLLLLLADLMNARGGRANCKLNAE